MSIRKTIGFIVAGWLALGCLFWIVSTLPAKASEPPTNRTWETIYDEKHSVFCATRKSAVSCVYVPRDTVR